MNKIIPAILATDFSNFKKQLEQISTWETKPPYVQIDIMDGQFVANTSFPEREEINDLASDIPLEIHLMMKNPLEEINHWLNVKNIIRIIVHVEAVIDLAEIKKICVEKDWHIGLAINPETDVSTLTPYLNDIDLVLFMTVTPGQQGSKFLDSVGKKIHTFLSSPDHPFCAVDGGINSTTLPLAKSWGVEVFCVGSAITMSANPYLSYLELIKI